MFLDIMETLKSIRSHRHYGDLRYIRGTLPHFRRVRIR